jgi:uncharacterized RDD family membrane protein YckC
MEVNMKCEKCGNEYPSQYYFETPTVCKECFKNMSEEEKQFYLAQPAPYFVDELAIRTGFGKRFAAALIDFLIVIIIILLVYNATGFFESATILGEQIQANPTDVVAIEELTNSFMEENMQNFYFSYILILVFFSLEILIGATVGKLILGIQIADSNRRKASTAKLLTRYLIKNSATFVSIVWLLTNISIINTLSTIVTIALIVGFFFVLSQKRQAFHDMIADTAVFNRNDIITEEANQNFN